MSDIVCTHEAGHCVVARALDVEVERATAGDDPGVHTKFDLGDTATEAIAVLEKLMLVDLAGAIAERRLLREAWRRDERNALSRALRIVLLQDGDDGDQTSDAQYARGQKLIEQLRAKAAKLVGQHWPAISRVAEALAETGELDQAQIDAAIAAT
jgi:hypothetical protein